MASHPIADSIAHSIVDTDQGRWHSAWWVPPRGSPLAGAVELIWHFDGRLAQARERVFPGGTVELILQLEGRYQDVIGERCVATPLSCVTGLHSRAFVVQAPSARLCVLGLRLRPLAAHRVLGHSLHAATDLTLDLDDLLRDAAAALTGRCLAAPDADSRIRLAVDWLVERLQRAAPVDAGLCWMLAQMEARHGGTGIEALREQAGYSRNAMQAAFRRHVGVSPKHYARLLRFRHLLEHLRQPPAAADGIVAGSLAELALAAGYYDQSHMNMEFRAFSGLTPREFLLANHYPGSTSIAEDTA
ncbi:MAG: helix-turn-helix domain-containing protein [Moraxellaceae bacterium]|nr:helix-turn-helix domain-containing protein [Moraxellaceae bacterium]